MTALSYRDFLEAKRPSPPTLGVPIDAGAVHPSLKPHQRDIVRWCVAGGRRGIFASFGLGKTRMELETMRLTLEHVDADASAGIDTAGASPAAAAEYSGSHGLIVAPLFIARTEFPAEAEKIGVKIRFIRTTAEIDGPGLYVTNYESVREGKIDIHRFVAVCLDEAAILRSLGTKTFREFLRGFKDTPYRFVATATPSPNDYIELLNYAFFLGVMDIGEAKTRFFSRNAERSDDLTIHPHKVDEFWHWVMTWAVLIQKPSDLGYSDEGYELPPLNVRWHAVGVDHSTAGSERDGQHRLLHDAALGLAEAAAAKRESIDERIAKVVDLVQERPHDHVIIWHDLESERRAIESSDDTVRTVYGSQDLEEREGCVADFANGSIARLAAKPVMLGSGCNLQRHCHWAIFAGVGFKFNDFIQAIHRIHRFLQDRPVTIDIVFAESEVEIVKRLRAKWKRHDEMMARMSALIRKYGLFSLEPMKRLERSIGVARRSESGAMWEMVNNDTVEETAAMPADSVPLIITSIPFSTQYEYTPSYNDFGHTDTKAHFFGQMDYLTPELFRVLWPGRILAVHVKDRVRPGGYDERAFQSIDFFHSDCIQHYTRHGFVGMGMISIGTDVVRENAQTYRLTWSMQCEDGSRMGVGMNEYILLFRKPPTDNTRGYADVPVEKPKREYTKGRWQMEADGVWRSNGNRLLEPTDLIGLPWNEVFQRFRGWTYATVYNHERVVAIAEAMDAAAQLPPDFKLLQPASSDADIWTDVVRMRSLNTIQAQQGREKHLCPLPFDIVERLIRRYSNEGELVFDPFAGLGTVTLVAVQMGRRGRGHELNPQYFDDAVRHLRAQDERQSIPTLFDLVDDAAEVPVG